MKKILSKKNLSGLIAIIALTIILVVINLISQQFYYRFDVTENKLYSLSEGTKAMLSELPEDVTLKLFYSSSLKNVPPMIKHYAGRVEDLLKEYQDFSDGALTIERIDPKIDSDEEEWAHKYGVKSTSINPRRYDEILYFGLVAEALDATATIPILNPKRERYLEYDISQLIFQVLNPEKKSVGILSSLPVVGNTMPVFMLKEGDENLKPWFLATQLESLFEVVNITTNVSEIRNDIDVLIVIHPINFAPKVQFAIDQYVMNGGKAIFFVDPLCTLDLKMSQMGYPEPGVSDLNRLFNAWGFNVSNEFVIADLINSTTISAGQNKTDKNPIWITATGSMFNKSQIACGNLESMFLPISGAVEKLPNSTINVTPLITTSSNSMAMAKQFGLADGFSIKQRFKSANKGYNLAASFSGELKTAFPDGFSGKTNLVKSCNNSVIVVADVDLLGDQFNIRPVKNMFGGQSFQRLNNNLDFVANLLDQLSGDKNLISIRARSNVDRPFTVVKAIERQAQNKYLEKEKQLAAEYNQVQQRIIELETSKDESQKMIVNDQQKNEIKNFQKQKSEIAKELRNVRKKLNNDKEQLGFKLKIYNIVLMPVIVCLFGIILAVIRHSKIKR